MEPKKIFITTFRGNGKSEMMFRELKKALKHVDKAAFVTTDAFDKFRIDVQQFMEEKSMEKKCKFKVGDKVINNSCNSYAHTGIGFIGEVVKVFPNGDIGVRGKSVSAWPFLHGDGVGEWIVKSTAFDLYNPHEGKILIMVDEKDNNKIIARDLITNKTAEAKCSPKDEWDFNKGAKLALERLMEPEKPKGWTGKVVCVSNTVEWRGHIIDNSLFEPGKVYDVINGDLFYRPGKQYTGIKKVTGIQDLAKNQDGKCPVHCDFIEYKGEVKAP